jgi:hypothetical protein
VKTEIRYGVCYLASGIISPTASEDEANRIVERLLSFGIPVEVKCQRVTYGVWMRPRVKLLSRK